MTDAIKVIRTEKECVLRQNTDECNRCCEDCDLLLPTEDVLKGYDAAISALEQEPCDKCVYSTKDGYCQYDDITETIPPFEPCEDAVSRGVFEQVMRERDIAIEQLHELGYELGQKIEPCDAVSREAVLNEFYDMTNLYERIKELPSVTVRQTGCDKCAMNGSGSKYCDNCKYKRQTGEWIEEPGKIPKCSICGIYSDDADKGYDNFCPNCGADMRGAE